MFEEGVNMRKDKWKTIRDIIVGNCKIVFPVLVVIAVAVTVVIALNANKAEAQTQAEGQPEGRSSEQSQADGSDSSEDQTAESGLSAAEVPMLANEDSSVLALVETYYNAIGTGDTDTLLAICHGISENNVIYYGELSKYIDHYSDIDIYSKQGPEEGATIAYVYYKMGITDYGELPGYEALYICTQEDGTLYIKDESVLPMRRRNISGLPTGRST